MGKLALLRALTPPPARNARISCQLAGLSDIRGVGPQSLPKHGATQPTPARRAISRHPAQRRNRCHPRPFRAESCAATAIDATMAVHGSAQLSQRLLEHDLVDELHLMVSGVVLGPGSGSSARRLTRCAPTSWSRSLSATASRSRSSRRRSSGPVAAGRGHRRNRGRIRRPVLPGLAAACGGGRYSMDSTVAASPCSSELA